MSRFERWAVWSTSVLTTLTGLVYIWMKYFIPPSEPWAVVNHPWQPLVLKAHILVAPLLVFAVGLIAMRHIWRHFRANMRVGRRTGIGTALFLGPMVATGYLIQAATGAGWIRALGIAHIGLGILYAVGLGAHQVLVRRAVGPTEGGAPRAGPAPARGSAAAAPSRSRPARRR